MYALEHPLLQKGLRALFPKRKGCFFFAWSKTIKCSKAIGENLWRASETQ